MSRCSFCGHRLQNPQARFCSSCGRPLAPSAPPPEVPPGPSPGLPAEGPRLIISVPGQSLQEVALNRPAFTLGRHADNDIILPMPYVSGHHGRLEQRGPNWFYTDLGSTNGTFHNGRKLPPHQAVSLQDGDILRIGDPHGNSVGLTFRAGTVSIVPGVSAGVPAAPSAIGGTVHIGSMLLGTKTSLLIGRNPQADVPLQAPTVSWHHARLDRTPQGYVLTDLGSTNGTFVNGQRLVGSCLLRPGDVVQIGPFRLVYEATGIQKYAVTGGMRLDGIRLVREVGRGTRKKRILEDVSISILPREFVALVGASGAGKTTLMMALNGFVRADQGQVLVNGDDLYQHFDLYRTLIGYVPQDDIIHKDLTVADALRYAARLRLPPDTSDQEIEQRIDQVLEEVGMLAQKNQVISSLSGGQRKRVNIAVELLADPRLFFLDEPTSGLDPGLEKKMMHTLRHLADGGRTVVLVTHATANITQCDHVCFMAQGRMVFFGPPHEALRFFGVTSGDFADIYAQLDDPNPQVARQKAAEWEQRFRASLYYQQYVASRIQAVPQVQRRAARTAAGKRPRVNPFLQFLILTRRYLNLVVRDRLLLTVLLAVMPVIALLLLLIAEPHWLVGDSLAEIERQLAQVAVGQSVSYSVVGKSQTLLLMLALAAVLLGLFGSAYEIVKERPIYLRERMVTLRLLPYLGSKVAVLGIFALLQCLLFLLVVALKIRLPKEGVLLPAPIEMYLSLVMGAWAAILLGLMVSALVPNTNSVIYVILLLLFFQIIFSGALFELPEGTRGLSVLTLSRWTTEALGTSANLEYLNTLSRTRFLPEPFEASVDVSKPAEDWEPVTVVTQTQQMPITCPGGVHLTVPISVPQVTVNEMVTVTETVTRTVEPAPVDVNPRYEFQIDYTRSRAHLFKDWAILAGYMVAFGIGTLIALKRRDVG
ncbi:MAG: FHA domain-containing protein [Anaerolineae bacterium]|nr:FHA domain-containing protein [Anaerolineae bacterium]MCX8068454.1 FHA domain-containing protein [Anaerolineae bacterium]MDW7992007.1 FHA domain-containing protein [Anaerolineae bacterium]